MKVYPTNIHPTNENHLTTTQRNDVFRTLQVNGLAPAEFDWTWGSDSFLGRVEEVPTLHHRQTDFWFKFGLGQSEHEWQRSPSMYRYRGGWAGQHCVQFKPGVDSPTKSLYHISWDLVVQQVAIWATLVKKERDATDLWATLAAQRTKLETQLQHTDNTPFAPAELTHVNQTLDRLVSEVQRIEKLQQHHFEQLVERIDYSREAAGRIGRKDWVMLFVGNVVSFLTQTPQGQSVLQAIWQAAVRAVTTIFGGVPAQLPPPSGYV